MEQEVIVTESDTPQAEAPEESHELQNEESDAVTPEDTPEDEQSEAKESEDSPGEDEEVEFDFGGSKERFKKTATVEEVADRLQDFSKKIYSDYIQKTQKVSAQAKILESRAEELNVLGEASQEYFAHYGTALQQGKYLEQLRSTDMAKLWQDDPDQARRVSDEIRRVEGTLQQLFNEMTRVESDTKAKHTEITAKRIEEGKKAINASIPDFESKYAADVVRYVTSTYSISEEDAQKWALSPEVTKMAYKAMLYDRSKAQAKAPPKVKQAEVPVKAIKGRGTVKTPDPTSPDSDNLSDAEWFALRNKQVYGR